MATLSHLTVPPSKARALVVRCLLAGLVPYVRSSPGIGKSDIMKSIADEYRLKLIDLRLSQCDVTDLHGLPRFTNDGRAEYSPFSSFPLEGDELPLHPDGQPYEGWLLFLDEISSAGKQMQAAAYKLLLDRMVGQSNLHKKVLLACAGNLETDRAVVHGTSTAMQSRLVHIEMRCDHREWMQWASKQGIDSRIIGFLEFKPDYLHKFEPDHQDKTFACPRTWEFAHRLVKGESITNSDIPLLAGTVSAGVAQEFVQFAQIYADLPKMSDILKDPKSAPVPQEPSTKFAMSTVVADHFTDKTADDLAIYIQRYPVEHRVVMLRMVHQRQPQLMRHKAVSGMFQELLKHM
ncbi:hypothetical protein [Dyella sp. ASV21]|uniref:hypothetical protein n=1 Tax=Dyella sp. ASV21 TaxID=2795114 RepID=UPI0018ED6950|nr:hypothetical protein [Dyella sp. ASV21]